MEDGESIFDRRLSDICDLIKSSFNDDEILSNINRFIKEEYTDDSLYCEYGILDFFYSDEWKINNPKTFCGKNIYIISNIGDVFKIKVASNYIEKYGKKIINICDLLLPFLFDQSSSSLGNRKFIYDIFIHFEICVETNILSDIEIKCRFCKPHITKMIFH